MCSRQKVVTPHRQSFSDLPSLTACRIGFSGGASFGGRRPIIRAYERCNFFDLILTDLGNTYETPPGFRAIEGVSTTDVTVATIILPLRGREWFKENRSRSNHVILNLNFNRSTLHWIIHGNLCELMCLMWFNKSICGDVLERSGWEMF